MREVVIAQRRSRLGITSHKGFELIIEVTKMEHFCPKHPALTSHDMTKTEKHSDGFSKPVCEISETLDRL